MKKVIVILSVINFLISCKKEESIIYSTSIIGEWNWLSTCGGFSGLCGTPQNTNSTAKITFSQDSIYYSYHNDSLVFSNAFSIIQKPVDHNNGLVLIDKRLYNYYIFQDTLSFQPFGADFGSAYKRIK